MCAACENTSYSHAASSQTSPFDSFTSLCRFLITIFKAFSVIIPTFLPMRTLCGCPPRFQFATIGAPFLCLTTCTFFLYCRLEAADSKPMVRAGVDVPGHSAQILEIEDEETEERQRLRLRKLTMALPEFENLACECLRAFPGSFLTCLSRPNFLEHLLSCLSGSDQRSFESVFWQCFLFQGKLLWLFRNMTILFVSASDLCTQTLIFIVSRIIFGRSHCDARSQDFCACHISLYTHLNLFGNFFP